MRQRRLWGIVLGFASLLLATSMASAQVDIERFQRQLEQIRRDTREKVDLTVPAEQRTLVDVGGYFTLGFLSVDDREGNNHQLHQFDFNGYGRIDIDGVHEFFVRGRATYQNFNTGDAFVGDDNNWDGPVLDRATYKFDLQRAMSVYNGEAIKGNFIFEGGRQLVHWANGLVLSRDLDGAALTFSYERWALEAIAGVTVKDEIDYQAGRPEFTGDTSRTFAGGLLSYQLTPRHRPFVYGLVQLPQGNNRQTFDPDGTPANGDEFNVNYNYVTHYIGAGSTGALNDHVAYGIEFAYEGGEHRYQSGSDTIPIQAFAADVKLDYLFNDANKSRVSSELIIATGDNDTLGDPNAVPGGISSGRDRGFHAFGLLNTGLAFNPDVNNLIMGRLGVSTFPFPTTKFLRQFQVGIDGLVFSKMQGSAPTDDSTNDHSFLGSEVDLYSNWRITSDLALSVRYGVFFPGTAVTSDRNVRQFLYTGLTLDF
jgi:hypothetical protein